MLLNYLKDILRFRLPESYENAINFFKNQAFEMLTFRQLRCHSVH